MSSLALAGLSQADFAWQVACNLEVDRSNLGHICPPYFIAGTRPQAMEPGRYFLVVKDRKVFLLRSRYGMVNEQARTSIIQPPWSGHMQAKGSEWWELGSIDGELSLPESGSLRLRFLAPEAIQVNDTAAFWFEIMSAWDYMQQGVRG